MSLYSFTLQKTRTWFCLSIALRPRRVRTRLGPAPQPAWVSRCLSPSQDLPDSTAPLRRKTQVRTRSQVDTRPAFSSSGFFLTSVCVQGQADIPKLQDSCLQAFPRALRPGLAAQCTLDCEWCAISFPASWGLQLLHHCGTLIFSDTHIKHGMPSGL